MPTTKTATPAGLPTLPQLPLMCGPAGDIDGDLNRSWICAHSHHLFHLYSEQTSIRDSHKRLARLENTGKTWKAGNLRRWIIEATERHIRLLALIQDRYSCTHPVDQRAEMTFEDALPACTC